MTIYRALNLVPCIVLCLLNVLTYLVNKNERYWVIEGEIISRQSMKWSRKRKGHLDELERSRKASWRRQDHPGPTGAWENCSRGRSRHTQAKGGASPLKGTCPCWEGRGLGPWFAAGTSLGEWLGWNFKIRGFIPDSSCLLLTMASLLLFHFCLKCDFFFLRQNLHSEMYRSSVYFNKLLTNVPAHVTNTSVKI